MDIKKIIIPVAAVAVITTGAFAINKAMANGEGKNSWSQNLATKLGVDESKVSTAIDEIQTEERQSQLSDSIAKAVEAGVITEDQKQSVIDKQNELQKKQQALNDEMKTWAEQNSIDYEKLQQYLGKGMGKGMGGGPNGQMSGNAPEDAPQTQNSQSSN